MTLRDYQQQCEDSIYTGFATDPCVLAVMATGLGKTVVAASAIKRMHPKRTMFLAHREELIFQARDKIQQFTGLGCEIEMADLKAHTDLFHRQDVVISTIQTQVSGVIKRRMERFNPEDFGLLIVDEVHHATAKTYRKVIDWYRQNPNLKVLGITATPDRTDEEALGQIFTKVAFNFGIEEGIESGWLVPISQRLVKIKDLDFSHIRTTAGDLNGGDLALVMEAEKNLQGVAGASIEIIGERRAIVFAASVKQAQLVCGIFNRHKPNCSEWICGTTDKEERRDRLKRFAAGQFQIICNCAVLTEGFDDPGVEVIIMAKPTKSRSLYTQMVGRSTRPLPGIVDGIDPAESRMASIAASRKPGCLVVDFTGNSGRHKLVTAADILGGKYSEEVRELAKRNLVKTGISTPMQQVLKEAAAELKREQEERERRDAERRAHIAARVSYTQREINPFNRGDVDTHTTTISKDGRAFSPNQSAMLRKNGHVPENYSYAQGQAIIGKIFSQASEPQAKLLRRAGYSESEIKSLDRKSASQTIDALAKNGWRRPIVKAEPKITAADVPAFSPQLSEVDELAEYIR